MADESMALYEQAETRDRLRELVRDALCELMELEAQALTGAP